MTNINKTLQNPDLLDVLNAHADDIKRNLNCVKIGKINSFDQTKKTAKIQITFKRVLPDKIVSYPLLVDCPVFTLQGGGGALQMPIAAGDPCIVLFSDRNIDNWFLNGAEAAPANMRCHDLSDGIALVGINPLNSDLPNYDGNVNLTLPSGKKFVVSGNATAEILGSAALALLSELNHFISTYNSHVHTANNTATLQTESAATGTTKLKGS
jgi:hypothetical protein